MKFLVTKDLEHSALLGNLMSAVVFAIMLYLGLDVVLHGYVIGWNIPLIYTTLYGNAEAFEEPILLEALLLQVHIDLFMTLFSVLILTAIYIRLFSKNAKTKKIVHTVFLLGMLAPLFLLLAFFTGKIFVYLWMTGFLLWHLTAIFIALTILKKLLLK